MDSVRTLRGKEVLLKHEAGLGAGAGGRHPVGLEAGASRGHGKEVVSLLVNWAAVDFFTYLGPVSDQEVLVGRIDKVDITRTQLNIVAANNFDRRIQFESKISGRYYNYILSNFSHVPLKLVLFLLLV